MRRALLAGLFLLAPFAGAESASDKEILAPIHALIAAFDAGDAAAMLRQVHPEGRVTATGARQSGTGLRKQTWAEFAERVKPDSTFQERLFDLRIDVDGDIAMVWAPFVVSVKGKVTNCGVDLFDLVRDAGTWKVVNLTFSSRTTGCPAR